jgi:hypothetical protein
MRAIYDDFDEIEFEVTPVLKSIRREQRRQENRYAKRRNPWRRAGDYISPDDQDDYRDYDRYTEYDSGH